jgi:iron complex outermembrane receptor protein
MSIKVQDTNMEMKLVSLLFACLIVISLHGAQPDSVYQDTTTTTIRLDEVLVKAARFDTKVRKIPGSVQLLSHEKFLKTELANLSEIVNKVPGVYMQSGSFQTSRLTIRGIGSRNPYGSGRIRAFYDDIPLTTGDGTTIIEDIEPYFIDKAEITKGPNSAWYGSGIGGSIRFFSPVPDEKTTIQLFTGAASFGSYKMGGIAKIKLQKGSLNVGISRVASNGYRQNSNYFRNSFFVSGTTGIKFRINYLVHASDVNARLPSSINENTYQLNPQMAATNWLNVKGYKAYQRFLGGIRLENNFRPNVVNSINLSGSISNPFELRPFNILDDNSGSTSLQENLKIVTPLHTFLIGGEWLHENYNWQILQNQTLNEQQKARERRNQANGYLSMQTTLFSPLLFSFSLNLNHTRYTITDLFEADQIDYSGKTDGRYVVSPKLGISIPLLSNITFYASYGNGFSNPTVEESLNSQGFLNSSLKPEQGWGLDIGLRAFILNKKLWVDVTYYDIQLRDLLVTKRISEELFSGENGGNASLKGIELLAQFRPKKLFQANLSFQQSVNRFRTFSGEFNYSGNRLPGIPSFFLNSDIELKLFSKLRIDVNVSYYGKQFMNDDNSKVSRAWKTVDIKIIKDFNLPWSLLEFQMGIKNLLNEKYASMILVNAPSLGGNPPRYYYPGLPSNFYFSLRMNI